MATALIHLIFPEFPQVRSRGAKRRPRLPLLEVGAERSLAAETLRQLL